MKIDFRPLAIVLLLLGAIAWFVLFRGETELNDEIVKALIDDSDRHFRNGNSAGVCAQRASDFTLNATTYNFVTYQQPSSFADIEEKESSFERQRASDYTRNNSYSHTYSRTEFCEYVEDQAEKLRETYRRRTNLSIRIDFDEKKAQYEAEYVLVAPLPEGYEYPKGATGDLFLYSRMSESGTVALEDLKPVVKSARTRLRQYWIYPANIPEPDRPVRK